MCAEGGNVVVLVKKMHVLRTTSSKFGNEVSIQNQGLPSL
jgi:hypothetical protein